MTNAIPYHHRPLAAAIALALSGSAGAAVIPVDGTSCKLVDAIAAANTDTATNGCAKGSGADNLNLIARPPVYTLATVDNDTDGPNGLPSVISVITVNGDPDGDGKGAVIQRSSKAGTPVFRLVHIAVSGKLAVKHVALRNGQAVPDNDNAGGINNHGTITLTNSSLSGNSGGGLLNYGAATLVNSTLSGNSAKESGGGLFNATGKVTLTNSTVAGNLAGESGGGLFNGSGTVVLTNCRLTGNGARFDGGGLINYRGDVTLINSTISGNHATNGGGIYNSDGNVELVSSTVSLNRADGNPGGGGGICSTGNLTVSNSTIFGNTVGDGFGGGIYGGNVTLVNSTVSGNFAGSYGGGFANGFNVAGSAKIVNSTFFGNVSGSGGGFVNQEESTATLSNSLIANSTGDDCVNTGALTFSGTNLIEDGSCAVKDHGGLTGDPKLGPLLDNGGRTFTRALLAGSPAIDKGSDALCPKTDQREAKRPQGTHCDIGAFEWVATAAPDVKRVIDFFDEAAGSGQLRGTGKPARKPFRLEAVRDQLLLAGDFLQRQLPKQACPQLKATIQRINAAGTPDQNDYVTGTAGKDLAVMIATLRKDHCG